MDIIRSLYEYKATYQEEELTKKLMLTFLMQANKPLARETVAGHLTASALLLNSDKSKFMLMHHKKLNKWLQPGGHADNEEDLLKVAINEAAEESGIPNIEAISKQIFDIDIHEIPKYKSTPAHYHYDFRFVLKTIDNDNLVQNEESNDLKWFDLSHPPQNLEWSVLRLIEKYNKILKSQTS